MPLRQVCRYFVSYYENRNFLIIDYFREFNSLSIENLNVGNFFWLLRWKMKLYLEFSVFVYTILWFRWLQSPVLWKRTKGLRRRYMSWQRMRVVVILPFSQTTGPSFTWELQILQVRWNCLKMSRWSCLGTMWLLYLSWSLQFHLMQVRSVTLFPIRLRRLAFALLSQVLVYICMIGLIFWNLFGQKLSSCVIIMLIRVQYKLSFHSASCLSKCHLNMFGHLPS